MSDPSTQLPKPPPNRKLPQHGVNGVYYKGDWVDIEDCVGTFNPPEHIQTSTKQFQDNFLKKVDCSNCSKKSRCRSKSEFDASHDGKGREYDVVIIGAGCIGSAIARELSKYQLSTLLLEAADDVSQGATKGNSGIVHAGYDDKPNTNRAKYCWKGNQMFPQLDAELRFGYQKNGSLVIAMNDKEMVILDELMERGRINGVERLKILNKEELFAMEPAINPLAIGALYSPDAGNVIPYEYAIALAENAVDNGVELRIRREVTQISQNEDGFLLMIRRWEPQQYIDSLEKSRDSVQGSSSKLKLMIQSFLLLSTIAFVIFGINASLDSNIDSNVRLQALLVTIGLLVSGSANLKNFLQITLPSMKKSMQNMDAMPFTNIVNLASPPVGQGGSKVSVEEMFVGGSGSPSGVHGSTINDELVQAKYVINCAGGASDKISSMIGDNSFKIKPRLGDYLLLNRNQGHLTSKTIFPCPDPILGKGVLVQTTLWGNLILGPTARDTYKQDARDMSDESVQEYILSKCKQLVPYFDPRETFHAFCGARAKSDKGDWIIERSTQNGKFINVAGIDSPGLAGSPAIACEVVNLLQEAGLKLKDNPTFNPHREPIITPKRGMKGLKMGPVGKNDSEGNEKIEDVQRMASNVICKCEKVTELEVVRAIRRSLPIDSSQAIRKRTRAGMGHCQADKENYDCESRVRAIIARETQVPIEMVGGRPWPATSTLPQRWISEKEKENLLKIMTKEN